MNYIFIFLIISNSLIGMEVEPKSDESDYISVFIKNDKTTLAYIAAYQLIWRENKENLIQENKIDQGDNICSVVKNLTTPSPEELQSDQQVQEIVKKFISNQNYILIHKSAEKLISKKEFANARTAWSHCRYKIAELCQGDLKEKQISLDIREQESQPFYCETFDFEKINEANKFFLLNNRSINHPLYVVPYLKAYLIMNAIQLQNAGPFVATSLQGALIKKAKEKQLLQSPNRLRKFLHKFH